MMRNTRGLTITTAAASAAALLLVGCSEEPEPDAQPTEEVEQGHTVTLTTLPEETEVSFSGEEPEPHSGTQTYEVDESEITADGGVRISVNADGFGPRIATYDVDEEHDVALLPQTDEAWNTWCEEIGDDEELLAEHDPEGNCESY